MLAPPHPHQVSGAAVGRGRQARAWGAVWREDRAAWCTELACGQTPVLLCGSKPSELEQMPPHPHISSSSWAVSGGRGKAGLDITPGTGLGESTAVSMTPVHHLQFWSELLFSDLPTLIKQGSVYSQLKHFKKTLLKIINNQCACLLHHVVTQLLCKNLIRLVKDSCLPGLDSFPSA